MARLSTTFDSGTDGVLTGEVGVISGRLELRSTCADDGALELSVTYDGADEWYTLAGSGARLHDPADHEVVHRLLVAVCSRPAG